MVKEVYLDNSATTRVRDEVAALVMEAMTRCYGNPSSLHRKGMEAEALVKRARQSLARTLAVKEGEIYFTSGGTEANNLAIQGGARARRGNHLVTTVIEHPSVLNTFLRLEAEGFQVTYLPVSGEGIVDPEELQDSLRPDTILVSTMAVNNEVGSIQPLEQIGEILARRKGDILWHVDAVQAFGKLDLRPGRLGIDLLSVSAHKIHGPKGIGALFVGRDIHLQPIFWGGDQEKGLRSGTENVPGIVGLGEAARLAREGMKEDAPRMASLRKRLIAGILNQVEGSRLNGPREGAPHIANLSFAGFQGEILVHALAEEGIYVSTGSACSSRQPAPSHVLKALGLSREEIGGALRFSLSPFTTEEDIDYALDRVVKVTAQLRPFQRR